jgi:uncharacterized protein
MVTYTGRRVTMLALGVSVLALGACSVLDPKPDGSRYFILRSLAEQPGDVAPLTDLVLGLGPVTLPEYLDRSEMLDLVGPYEMRYSPQNRWVEPLGSQVYRTLADNLQSVLEPDAIASYPWFQTEGVTLQVEVAFDPIRLDAGGVWRGGAKWVLRDAQTRVALERNDFSFQLGEDAIPPEEIARGLSDELGRLSAEIAVGVRRHYPR